MVVVARQTPSITPVATSTAPVSGTPTDPSSPAAAAATSNGTQQASQVCPSHATYRARRSYIPYRSLGA
ncbi:hypothetical protein NUW54_g8196 [Trametes sanguinea]|uniref:Uncharacterized protein n=1 Tax=Trametes sanguinea TaxID=158606 RepID=A0ACC1PG47_9APHY|nr:hypothetical protein NUW54_g8196 [Trametes sanguinea]